MALLYPWATKEYILRQMSLGQVIMYYNLGIEAKYPKQPGAGNSLRDKSPEEIKRIRDDLKAQYGDIGNG